MGPCAKQRVVAVVTHRSPSHDPAAVIIGENICVTPQATCPRTPGEAYVKCYTHCAQLGHAEETALRQVLNAGISPGDITSIDVYGHTGPCDNCRRLLGVYGLLDVTTFHPNIAPPALTTGAKAQIAAAYNLYTPSSHSKHAAACARDVTHAQQDAAQGSIGTHYTWSKIKKAAAADE